MMTQASTYNAGHPWYYILGGAIQKPKQILATVQSQGYQGYMADEINEADNKSEPARSETLRNIRTKVMTDFRRDLSRYRELAHALRQRRKQGKDAPSMPVCADIHTNISLKYCHLYNDLAHLTRLDDLLAHQPDLFGF